MIDPITQRILNEAKFRKQPDKEIRGKFSGETLEKLPSLKNVPMYLIAGCLDKEYVIKIGIPSQLNWQDHEWKPEEYPKLVKPYGFFVLSGYEGYRKKLINKRFHTFEAGNIIPIKDIKNRMNDEKFQNAFVIETMKVNVETVALIDEGTYRPFKIMISGIKSKLLNSKIVINLLSDVHDYNVLSINKRHFNSNTLQKFPECNANVVKAIKKGTLPKNNEGVLLSVAEKPTKGKLNRNVDSIELIFRYNNMLFSASEDEWKVKGKQLLLNTIPPSADIGKTEYIRFLSNSIITNNIIQKKQFTDISFNDNDEWEEYHTSLAQFEIDPKSVEYKYEKEYNRVEVTNFKIKRHFFKPLIPFNTMDTKYIRREFKIIIS
jgi:hypothetical protein